MVTTRWFAYLLLLAVAFAIGLIGTISASRALVPHIDAAPRGPASTTPTSTMKVTPTQPVEC